MLTSTSIIYLPITYGIVFIYENDKYLTIIYVYVHYSY